MEANGITEEAAKTCPETIERLELIHGNCPVLPLELATVFTGLRELCVVAQEIDHVSGLEAARNLETLWICECRLTRIEGLEGCTQLRRLYLYSNRISRIENIDLLKKLEVLWLNGNCLQNLNGLGELQSLKSLWAAGNRISGLGTCLDNLVNLTELNLADNRLSQLGAVSAALARLPALEGVSFSDDLFGSNPICQSPNYRTHILAHLKALKFLDGTEVLGQEIASATATFAKKALFYNVKVKQIRAMADSATASATGIFQKFIDEAKAIDSLVLLSKEIEREIALCQGGAGLLVAPTNSPPEVAEGRESRLREKLEATRRMIEHKESVAKQATAMMEALVSEVRSVSDGLAFRVMREHATAGMASFLHGGEDDPWAHHAVELFESRLFSESLSQSGVYRVTFRRVFKIRNSSLSGSFDSGAECRGPVELLFHFPQTVTESQPEFVLSLIENGFGGDSPIWLCNSVALAIGEQLSAAAKSDSDVVRCQVVVLKANLGKTAFSETPIREESTGTSSDSFDSVCRKPSPDPRQRSWVLFRADRVVPVFEIDFDVTLGGKKRTPVADLLSAMHPSAVVRSETQQLLVSFDSVIRGLAETFDSPEISKFVDDSRSSSPVIPERQKMEVIDEGFLLRFGSLPSITEVDMCGSGLSSADVFAGLPNLRTLLLAFNSISDVSSLHQLPCLEILDLCRNQVKSVRALGFIRSLRILRVDSNRIKSFEEVTCLGVGGSSKLEQLSVRGNPSTSGSWCRAALIRALPSILVLDGVPVSPAERDQCTGMESTSADVVRAGAHFCRRNSLARFTSKSQRQPGIPEATGDGWQSKAVELDLSGMGLATLRGVVQLDGFTGLATLDLCNNSLKDFSGGECLRSSLRELLAENNKIKDLSVLQDFQALRRLELSYNRLTSLRPLSGLVQLVQLSVGNNELTNLAGLQSLIHLKELYAPNNKIATARDVQLQDLPHLFVADFSGNPMSLLPEYRATLLNKVRSIRVLDGDAVLPEESAQAIARYQGCLDDDLVEQRARGAPDEAQVLDFSSAKLKVIVLSEVLVSRLRNLKELCIDGNAIVDVGPLLALPALALLKANSNRIESISPGQPIPTLLELEVSSNRIKSLHSLHVERFPNLRRLSASANSVSQIEGLEPASSRLEELALEKNSIHSLSGLTGLTNLRVLGLAGNRISEVVEFDKLKGLPILDLSVSGNTSFRKSHFLPTLFGVLPGLRVLDSKLITDLDRQRFRSDPSQEAEPEGPFTAPSSPRKVAIKPRIVELSVTHDPPSQAAAGKASIKRRCSKSGGAKPSASFAPPPVCGKGAPPASKP